MQHKAPHPDTGTTYKGMDRNYVLPGEPLFPPTGKAARPNGKCGKSDGDERGRANGGGSGKGRSKSKGKDGKSGKASLREMNKGNGKGSGKDSFLGKRKE